MLKKLTLLRDRVEDWSVYPFSVPVVASLHDIVFRSRVCFFTGENGSGKSTLLEAIAHHYGFGPEGGNRNLTADTTDANGSSSALARALRLSFDIRTGRGYFLRAESFFNIATRVDTLGAARSYGGSSLHMQSHGESFLTLLETKCCSDGLFLLDEPEAALSPQRQLAMIALVHGVLKSQRDAQFVISTHSPLLLGYPEAQILSFDHGLEEIEYNDTAPAQIARAFMNNRDGVLRHLLED